MCLDITYDITLYLSSHSSTTSKYINELRLELQLRGLKFSQRLPLCVSYEETNSGIQTVVYHRLIACFVFLLAVRRMSLDS